MLNVGSIIEGPFRLIRERPLAVAIWALVHLAFTAATFLMMRPVQATLFVAGNPRDLAHVWAMLGWLLPVYVLSLVVWTVTLAAAQRAILRPERSRSFYLRLGMDELRMGLLAILLLLLSYLVLLALFLVIGILIVGLGAAVGFAVKAIIGGLLGLACLVLFVWVEVRLSLAFPLTLLRRRIVIGESWRLTRGRFWTLFGGYLVLFLIMLVASAIAGMVAAGPSLAQMAGGGFNPAGINRAAQAQIARQASGLDPFIVLGWLAAAVSRTIGTALVGGAVATAARALAANREEIADTFA
jgi:hypothetical protein